MRYRASPRGGTMVLAAGKVRPDILDALRDLAAREGVSLSFTIATQLEARLIELGELEAPRHR